MPHDPPPASMGALTCEHFSLEDVRSRRAHVFALWLVGALAFDGDESSKAQDQGASGPDFSAR